MTQIAKVIIAFHGNQFMHEFSLCRYILEIVQGYCHKQDFHRVKKINLEVGELAVVDKESLLFAFDIVSKKTVAEYATLYIIDIPGEASCEACHKKIHVQQRFSSCGACGEVLLTIIRGDELRIKSMEIE